MTTPTQSSLENTLRSLSDKLRISREKLSFLVDSTAAPVAGIAPLSTWVAWEIMQISEGLKNAGVSDDVAGGLSSKLFLMSIPYRFYAIWMLVFVPMVAIMLRDFGPMRKAERDMRSRGRSSGMIEVAENVATNDENKITDGKWFNAALPIGLTLTMVIVLIFTTGYNKWKTGDENLIAVRAEIQPKIIDILGEADSPMALAYGALGGLALAAALALGQRLLSWKQIQEASVEGMKTILPAIAILVSAMALSGLTKGDTPKPGENAYPDKARMLYTGVYLGDLLLGEEEAEVSGNSGMSENSATPSKVKTVDLSGEEKNASTISARRKFLTRMLPTIVFVLSGIIAFCTGTSFGHDGYFDADDRFHRLHGPRRHRSGRHRQPDFTWHNRRRVGGVHFRRSLLAHFRYNRPLFASERMQPPFARLDTNAVRAACREHLNPLRNIAARLRGTRLGFASARNRRDGPRSTIRW